MSKKPLFIGAIASIIAINSVFADTTVTSKQYVDTTRQATIPVVGTNANTPGETVVTYTDSAGTIGERYICDITASDNDDCDDNNLVTVDYVNGLGDYIEEIEQQISNIPQTATTATHCVGWETGHENIDEYCILWNLDEKLVFGNCSPNGAQCYVGHECCGGLCDNNTCGSPS